MSIVEMSLNGYENEYFDFHITILQPILKKCRMIFLSNLNIAYHKIWNVEWQNIMVEA